MVWEEKKTLAGLSYYWDAANEDITWEKPAELQTREEIENSKGEWTWIPDKQYMWQPARRVETKSDGSVDCLTEDNKAVSIPKNRIAPGPGARKLKVEFWPLKRSSLLRTEEDLVMLDNINEASIIHNLRKRYEEDQLYTWVGAARSVLVSVNPYKSLRLYGDDQIDMYRQPPPNTKLEAHVFDIANDSFNSMLFGGRTSNQSILISGESGAGKTVATKQCLNFLARVSGSERNVEERVIAANPLLEAFGNAQTIRNNNSSRFGKWIKVYFDPMQRCIVAADIINYLLEKSRVVYQQEGERNYHVMYQLTTSSETRNKYSLGEASEYRYTNQSGCYKANFIDDEEDYQSVIKAMGELGFNEEEKDFAFRIAAGVLKLGNCSFKAKKEKGNVAGSSVENVSAANEAAELLGMDEKNLEKVLCYRSISVKGKAAVIPLDPEKARASVDSLAMGIYGRLFDWLVKKVNLALQGDAKDNKGVYIGILDIFGFEIFEQNSFEQLCINFANEKLQQQFNKTTFKEEEALYISEGIKFKHVEFIDNQAVLDLIEAEPRGVLPMLDDECLVPEGSDRKYINKVEDTHKKNEKFLTDKHRKLNDSYNFEISHYAGTVNYNSNGFIQKNRDSMFHDQYVLCARSSHGTMAQLFPKSDNKINNKSQSKQFRMQLGDLMTSLEETESRYIRCIKPNGKQVSNMFESPMVIDQLRYSGVFEAVDIRKQGYPFRLKYNQFAARYSCINRGNAYRTNWKSYEDRCKEIIETSKHDFSEAVFGRTMVLYRTNEHRTLTLLRELALETLIPKCQAVMRAHLAREMKRRCYKCMDELAAALRVANDIEMLDEAIANVEPTIGEWYMNYFPGVMPTNLKKAKLHREQLKRWMDLQEVFAKLNVLEEPTEREHQEMIQAVAEAKTMLHVPQTKLQKELYEKAVVQVEYMDIYLKDKKIESNPGKYDSLRKYSGLRDIIDYSKNKKKQEGMCVWEKKKIPTTMTPIDDKEEKAEALKMYENLLCYTYLKKNVDPDAAGLAFLQAAVQSDAFKNEAYCQLIKMTTGGEEIKPKDELAMPRAWDLLAGCVSNFVPTDEHLELILKVHVAGAPDGRGQNFRSQLHETKYTEKAPNTNNLKASQNMTKGKERTRYSVRA